MKKMNETYEAPVAEIIEMVNTPAVWVQSWGGGNPGDDGDD
jgi:hypothetical protein